VTDPRTVASLVGALVAGVVGLVAGNAAAFLVATVPLAYAAHGHVSRVPDASVAVERTVSERSPRPGERVEVTLSVTNVGPTTLPDLRVGDDVPDRLPVVEGSPAACTSLQSGETVTLTYAVEARRGSVTFGDPTVVVRGTGGDAGTRLTTDASTTLSCHAHVEGVALPSRTIQRTGRIETDAGGEGVEFHSTREYQPGDPLSRIDWNRFAATDELATVAFRETRAATVLVVVATGSDAEHEDGPAARTLSEYAAAKTADALLDNHNRVGVAKYGGSCRFVAPGTGHEQSAAIERFLDGDGVPGELIVGDVVAELRKRLSGAVQVLYCSSFLDDDAVRFVERLVAHGHPVTVVSPDVTSGADVPGTVERIERAARLRSVRSRHVRTVDWAPDTPLDAALERAAHGWSG